MARMHSRSKGKAGSKKPLTTRKVTWQSYDEKELRQIIIKLAKEQKTPSQIGLILRDSYGIPSIKQIAKNPVSVILKEGKISHKVPEDLLFLIKKVIKIMRHLELNKKDQPSVRGLQLTESKIKRLVKYYKRENKLPENWKYSRENAKLLIE